MPKKAKRKIKLIGKYKLREKLKVKQFQTRLDFRDKHKIAALALSERGVDLGKVRKHSAKIVSAGAITGSLILAPPVDHKNLPPPQEVLAKVTQSRAVIPAQSPRADLLKALKELLPNQTRPLTREEEKNLEQIFEQTIGIKTRATLEGEHLNTTYGKIGAEQHLRRFPGDTNAQHVPQEGDYGDENPNEILKEGIAPGLGAWGYFAPSKQALTPELEETEKWYAVVQTLYLKDWNTRQPHLKNWYKHRKVLIVNKENGHAVVASIADSGPAAFTGKHFGGSPEVMDYLGGPKYKKGPVILFFVDDPENTVPLGPVEYNTVSLPGGGSVNI